jgi:hypothetical protein
MHQGPDTGDQIRWRVRTQVTKIADPPARTEESTAGGTERRRSEARQGIRVGTWAAVVESERPRMVGD